jgi:hypothetical protein
MGPFFEFLGAPVSYNARSVFHAVNASLRFLSNVTGVYLVQVSLLPYCSAGFGKFLLVALASY